MQKSYQSVLAAFATQRTVNDELRWRYIKGAEECWSAGMEDGGKGELPDLYEKIWVFQNDTRNNQVLKVQILPSAPTRFHL